MNVKATPHALLTLTLELNEKEAMIVRAIFGSITGSTDGPRGLADAIWEALGELKIKDAVINGTLHLPDTWAKVVPEEE